MLVNFWLECLGGSVVERTLGKRLYQTEKVGKTSKETVEEFLEKFKQKCRVAWSLAESTWKARVRTARRLINFTGKHPAELTESELLEFLEQAKNRQDAAKGLRVIFGRFFKTDMAEDIKIPQNHNGFNKIPSDEKIRETYYNLGNQNVKTFYLMLASSGLRRGELCDLTEEDVDFEKRMITANHDTRTKRSYVTFYNREAAHELERLGRLPDYYPDTYTVKIKEANSDEITPQTLRKWFAEKMGKLGVSDRYIDAFCGRTPKSVLANNYTDFSPDKLREVYQNADLRVLE